MSRLVEFDLDSTKQIVILVETDDAIAPQGQVRVSVGGAVAEKAVTAFDAAIASIKPIARTVMDQLTSVVADASEISVEFGIKLTANAGVIIAGTAAEGNCKVGIKWTRKP